MAVTAHGTAGVESPFSSEGIYAVPIPVTLSPKTVKSNGVPFSLSISTAGMIPGHWRLQSSPDLKTWTTLAQGSNLAVNVLVPVTGLPDNSSA